MKNCDRGSVIVGGRLCCVRSGPDPDGGIGGNSSDSDDDADSDSSSNAVAGGGNGNGNGNGNVNVNDGSSSFNVVNMNSNEGGSIDERKQKNDDKVGDGGLDVSAPIPQALQVLATVLAYAFHVIYLTKNSIVFPFQVSCSLQSVNLIN